MRDSATNHRPSTTFCWLPPLSEPIGAASLATLLPIDLMLSRATRRARLALNNLAAVL